MANPVTVTLRDFGASSTTPSTIITSGNALQLFYQPSAVPALGSAGAGNVQPPSWSTPGTADGWAIQGRIQMPGLLLYGPNTGSLNGKYYTLVAAGSVIIPSGASNATLNVIINENYTTYGVAPIADSIFSLLNPISVAVGTTSWTLTATLAGNGIGTPTLSCAGAVTVGTTQYVGNGYSSRLQNEEPKLQLSIGIQFGGSSGASPFQASLTSFQMRYTTL